MMASTHRARKTRAGRRFRAAILGPRQPGTRPLSVASLPGIPAREDFLGHPKGVFVCFFTEMWERFSFYGMKALLLLYLLKHHRFTDDMGYDLIGAYGGLVYAVPVIGGMVADRWLGMRKAVVLGGVLLCLGHFGMAFEGADARVVDGVVVRDAGPFPSQCLVVHLAISTSWTRSTHGNLSVS